mmetsp:Transcript_39434/g.64519  ORF Transcript_39434/g.64519 Transcript_39434/m.64519 type:complete len:508 (-) Transcript_39434:501-2024(-)
MFLDHERLAKNTKIQVVVFRLQILHLGPVCAHIVLVELHLVELVVHVLEQVLRRRPEQGRGIARRLIQAQPLHHILHRRRVHHQRQHHNAAHMEQHAVAVHFLKRRLRLQNQRQRQSNRAAQPAIHHHHRVGVGAAVAGVLQQRVQLPDGECARHVAADVEHAQDGEVRRPVDVVVLLRHAERDHLPGDEEEQRVGNEADHLPEVVHALLHRRRDRLAVLAHPQAHKHDDEHAAHATHEVASVRRQVHRTDGEANLNLRVVVHLAQRVVRHEAAEDAHHGAAAGQPQKRRQHAVHTRALRRRGILAQHTEHDEGGAVVEQRLRLDQRTQPLRRAELFEQRHHRHRIRRRHHRAKHDAKRPRPVVDARLHPRKRTDGVRKIVHQTADQQRVPNDAGPSEQRSLLRLLQEDVVVGVEGALEDQTRNENGEHHVRVDGAHLLEPKVELAKQIVVRQLNALENGAGNEQEHRVRHGKMPAMPGVFQEAADEQHKRAIQHEIDAVREMLLLV